MTALFGHTGLRVRPLAGPRTGSIRCPFQLWILAFAVMTLMVAALPTLPARAEAPKLGGTLTYVIVADAPPSFDAHREATFATVYSGAPFYSVLIRVDPNNPSSNDFVCDLCTEMPTPTDNGRTYTFKIRDGVKSGRMYAHCLGSRYMATRRSIQTGEK